MKISKRTNRICLGLAIAALIGIFIYQVTQAKATNESSYKFGYETTVETSKCLATTVLTNNGDDCGRGEIMLEWICGTNNPTGDHAMSADNAVTNMTACDDGVINGFVHWCGLDHIGCIAVIKSGDYQVNSTLYKQQLKSDTGKEWYQVVGSR